MDIAKAKTLRVVDLRKELKKRGLSTKGRKAILQERLIDAINSENKEEADDVTATPAEKEPTTAATQKAAPAPEPAPEPAAATQKAAPAPPPAPEKKYGEDADLNHDGRTTRSESRAYASSTPAPAAPAPTPAPAAPAPAPAAPAPPPAPAAPAPPPAPAAPAPPPAPAAPAPPPAPATPAPAPAAPAPAPAAEPEDNEAPPGTEAGTAPAPAPPVSKSPAKATPLLKTPVQKTPGHIYVTANNLSTINLDDLKSFFGCVGTVTRLISLGHCVKVTYEDGAAATGALELNGTPFGHSGKLGIMAKEPSWKEVAEKQAAAKAFAERKAKMLAAFAPKPVKRKAPTPVISSMVERAAANKWEKRWDVNTGLAYYYNAVTRAKSDIKPHGFDNAQFEIADRVTGSKRSMQVPLLAGGYHQQKKAQEPAKKKWRPPNGMTFKEYKEHRKMQKWKRNGFI